MNRTDCDNSANVQKGISACEKKTTLSSLSPTELMFGMKVDTSSKESNIIRKLNFTFLYAKYYLYNQKLIHGELSVNEFIVNLKHKIYFRKMLCVAVVMMLIGM